VRRNAVCSEIGETVSKPDGNQPRYGGEQANAKTAIDDLLNVNCHVFLGC
jgi:hypothetical protein